jgi:hypothetical protein
MVTCPPCKKRHSMRVAFPSFCAGHWPPSIGKAVDRPPLRLRLPGWLLPLWAAHWRLLWPGTRCSRARWFETRSRYITGTFHIAIIVPFSTPIVFNCLALLQLYFFLNSGCKKAKILQKNIGCTLESIPPATLQLAIRAIMGSTPTQQDSPDRRSALPARLTRPLINAMLHLEESALAIGADII